MKALEYRSDVLIIGAGPAGLAAAQAALAAGCEVDPSMTIFNRAGKFGVVAHKFNMIPERKT